MYISADVKKICMHHNFCLVYDWAVRIRASVCSAVFCCRSFCNSEIITFIWRLTGQTLKSVLTCFHLSYDAL